jgi:glycerophosphoryl diester phosphodiesterase
MRAKGKSLLRTLPSSRRNRARLMVYGGTAPVELVHAKLPSVPIGSNKSLKSCLIRYFLLGWSGYVPDTCRAEMMLVPLNFAPWLWGWPDNFMQRLDAAGVHVFVLGPYDGSYASVGVDHVQQLSELPKGFSGGIWTNRIDRIGAAVRSNATARMPE